MPDSAEEQEPEVGGIGEEAASREDANLGAGDLEFRDVMSQTSMRGSFAMASACALRVTSP